MSELKRRCPLLSKRMVVGSRLTRNKIKRGLSRAAAKRPVSIEALSQLAEQLEQEICESGVREISSRDIGEFVLPRLRSLDDGVLCSLCVDLSRFSRYRRVCQRAWCPEKPRKWCVYLEVTFPTG